MLELGLESLFVLVDLLFVSRLGAEAITVVGITNSAIILIQSVATGLSIAATAMISRRVGQKKPRTAGLVAVQVLGIGLLLAAVSSIFAMVFSRQILLFAGASADLAVYGGLFARLMFAGVFFMILRILLNGIFRGSGNASVAMRTLFLSNAVNAALGALLIFGSGPLSPLGIVGAAIAVLVANMAGVIYQLVHLRRNQYLQIGRKQLLLVPSLMKRLWKLTFSGTVQYLVPASSRFVMIMIVARLGDEILAGYIIANRIILFTVLPAWGIANAAGVLTGQNLGARQPERAEASVWKTGMFNMYFLGTIALLLILGSRTVVGLFTDQAAIAAQACDYLNYMSVAYLVFGYTMVISRALNAAGAVVTVTLLNVLMFYVVQIPLAWLLAIRLDWGSHGIFTAIMVSELVLATACIIVFKKGKWKQVTV